MQTLNWVIMAYMHILFDLNPIIHYWRIDMKYLTELVSDQAFIKEFLCIVVINIFRSVYKRATLTAGDSVDNLLSWR